MRLVPDCHGPGSIVYQRLYNFITLPVLRGTGGGPQGRNSTTALSLLEAPASLVAEHHHLSWHKLLCS
jgi:hypothetical protein